MYFGNKTTACEYQACICVDIELLLARICIDFEPAGEYIASAACHVSCWLRAFLSSFCSISGGLGEVHAEMALNNIN